MVSRKDRNFIKQLIRDELVKQMNKSAFKTVYKPTDSTTSTPQSDDSGDTKEGE